MTTKPKSKNNTKVIAIIPAAGLGKRLGNRKKPFIELLGRPMLVHTLKAFEGCALIDAIIVVTTTEDIEGCKKGIIEEYGFKKVMEVTSGGKERQDSIARALDLIGDDCAVVVVHDAARPLVTPELIERTINGALKSGATITVVPLKDTVKTVENGVVQGTPRRDMLKAVQTPQAFKSDILKRAYCAAKEEGFIGTDDSSLVERIGVEVTTVEGANNNIKITTEEDLTIAECLLKEKI